MAGSVLYVAAHPDDENTALLAYLANGALVRTAYLSVTRGDGGQNLIGSEQGPALGLIRTQELLAARRIDGAEQFFTRARDFGFSKSPEETLRIWGKDAVLADMVAVIRKFRPDVLVTRFSPEPAETHGHHTASAILALEAFHAAADPKFHPEQLVGGVGVWQARRIFWNRSSFFIKPTDDVSGDVKLDVDEYNPLLGESYGEMAADSRSMHKSQGFGVARNRAPIVEYFKLLASSDAEGGAGGKPLTGILDGIDVTLKRFAGGDEAARSRRAGPSRKFDSGRAVHDGPGAGRRRQRAVGDLRRRLAGRETARGRQPDRRLRRAVRRRDGGRLPGGARDGRRGDGDRRRSLAGGGDPRRGEVSVRGERSQRRAQAGDAEAGGRAARRRRGPFELKATLKLPADLAADDAVLAGGAARGRALPR